MWITIKRQLGKLLQYPLFRQLWYERWFRWVFVAFILMFIALGLSLPKMWRTSKPGFLPVIKVSGLDLIQAWSLRRTAVKAAAAGKFEEANYAWLAALANNQADTKLVRGSLLNILKDPHRRKRAGQAIQHSFWLLKLTGTNISDLELVAQVFEAYRYYDPILTLAEGNKEKLTPGLTATYLKALFNRGLMDTFDARWNRLEETLKKDPELALYRAAYLAGWGPPGTITDARQQLDAASQDPARSMLASRLKLAVYAHELKASDYGRALAKLEEGREDTLSDHAGYWRLLALGGEKTEAMRLAQTYPNPPTSPIEVVELAQIYFEFGSRDEGLQILERYADEFGHVAFYWITYANVLMESKSWEDLRKVSLRIRSAEMVSDQLAGFSYFLEGRAELGLGRDANAVTAFRKAAEREFPYAGLGLRVASQIFQLGHSELSKQILTRLENPLQEEPNYWILLFGIADQMKDVDLLVKSATRAYKLRPQDPAVINNYAAALIISRQNPEEVIGLTLELFSQNPNSLHALVNHGAALLLNNRPKEAEALLGRVPTNGLTRAQLALYNLDLFEMYLGLEKYDLAWSISERIETNRLYPTQRQWFETKLQRLPPRQKSG